MPAITQISKTLRSSTCICRNFCGIANFNLIEKDVTINARKYDRRIQRSWQADLLVRKDSLLVFLGVFDREVIHQDLGVIRRGTISYEYYWLERWYNVFRFHEPEGELRNFYCNINMPPVFEDSVLDYVDLDIDLLVRKDFTYTILDETDYLENSRRYGYPENFKERVDSSVKELRQMIKSREFPFTEVRTDGLSVVGR